MASVEFLQKRVDGKKKELDKLNTKLKRIRKVEAQGWKDPNPYYYSESDLKWCLKDIEEAEISLADYEAQLEIALEKQASRDIQVIIDFLEMWKQNVTDYYHHCYDEYLVEYEEYCKKEAEFVNWYNSNFWKMTHGGNAEEAKRIEKEWKEYRKEFNSSWNFLMSYVDRGTFDNAKLSKDLYNEANNKYDFIIERTNAIVGTITDASDLHIGAKGDLNGYIIGTKGTAKVQTIGAGGYNIQCFHFRTLINKAN